MYKILVLEVINTHKSIRVLITQFQYLLTKTFIARSLLVLLIDVNKFNKTVSNKE